MKCMFRDCLNGGSSLSCLVIMFRDCLNGGSSLSCLVITTFSQLA